jgi:leucyl aminopeptidase
MRITHSTDCLIPSSLNGALVIGVFQDGGDVASQVKAAGWEKNLDAIAQQAEALKFKGESGKSMTCFVPGQENGFVFVCGLGKPRNLKRRGLCSALEGAVKAAKDVNAKTLTLAPISIVGTGLNHTDFGHVVTEAAMRAQYHYTLRTKHSGYKPPHTVEALHVLHPHADVGGALSDGEIIAQGIAFARTLSDMPPNYMHPQAFKDTCIKVQAALGGMVQIDVLDPAQIGAGGIVHVGRGSSHPNYLIRLRYTPKGGPTKIKMAFVGKSVCFDAGGLAIKPASGMEDMKRDMTGGANQLGAFEIVVKLGLNLSVNAYFAPVFNMLGPDAAQPGEVMTMLSGHTVEDKNPDAEGRLTLADMVEQAQRDGCNHIVQMATLTGAALHVVGSAASCVMGNNDRFLKMLLKAGQATGELMQPLTIFDEIAGYNKPEKRIADIHNTPGSKMGGCVAAGAFCREFVRPRVRWLHMDIAPVMDSGHGIKSVVHLARQLEAIEQKRLNKAA